MSAQMILAVLRDLIESNTRRFSSIMVLEEPVRNRALANNYRETLAILDLLNILARPPEVQEPTRRFTINLPASEILRAFEDPVPVVATADQITAATEMNIATEEDSNCAICQESMAVATRLRACNHVFHHSCINTWFRTSVRCPVCRNDIREPLPAIA
jgi:Ring finger domain